MIERGHNPGAAIPFLDLPTGRWAHLADAAAGDSVSRRLQDLGFVPGTRVLIVRRAPFGDPLEIELRGYRLCVRRSQIEGLWVLPEQST